MMKILFFILAVILFSACGTTPPNTLSKLKEKKLPGYWVKYKNVFGTTSQPEVESFVQIGCDGNIRYEINEPYALLFKKSSDDGKIKSISDNNIEFKSWIGLSWNENYNGPIKTENGCHELYFKGKRFVANAPTDCTKPPMNISDAFELLKNSLKDGSHKSCD